MLECANFLAEHGHETHAFATDWEKEGMNPAVTCHHVRKSRLPAFLSVPAFVKACQQDVARLIGRPDVIAGFGAASAPDSVVWMQSVHAAWLNISQQTRRPWPRIKQRLNPFHPVILHLEKRMLTERRYRKIIALTDRVRDDIMNFYGVPEGDIDVIPNGYSPQEFDVKTAEQMRAQMREKLGFCDDDIVIGFVANEIERKGLRPLLHALELLKNPQLHILAVGRLDASQCAGDIERLGLARQVHFTGPTSRVADYFAAADIFALPTQYEAWGLVIIEAMATGLPVLTSRLAGAAIAVREGETGFLLDDPADAEEIATKLNRLVGSQHLSRSEIAQSVSKYQWSEVLLRYEQTLAACAD